MAKNTSTFLNDIKNYDLIRQLLHHIYMYGNYSKGDIVKNNIVGSERSVYDMITRIKNYLGNEYLITHNLPNRKKDKRGYRLKYDPFLCPINYLADSYKNRSYVVEDLIFYFTLLQSFKPYPKYNAYQFHEVFCHSEDVSELVVDKKYDYDTLMSNFHDILMANEEVLHSLGQSAANTCGDSESIITPAKARHRLHELVELGIITKENNQYSLAIDIFEDFEEDLYDLKQMVCFFYNFTELCIPGYYLSTTLAQYEVLLGYKHGFEINEENPLFFYKNHSLQNVIDDDIFWTILCAIDDLKAISLKYRSKTSTMTDYVVYPIKLIVEEQYGRHYLFAYNYAYENYILLRVDSIFSVDSTDSIPNDNLFCFLNCLSYNIKEQLNSLYITQMKDVWNITRSEKTYEVLIHFSFPKNEYQKILNRVKATGRKGTIKHINATSFDFYVKTKSPIEMKPWIRNFGEYAVVDKIQCPELFDDIKEDYRKALEAYGTF